jgi:long-subunit acyl-CoA synthetase (AMP-forming)
VGGRGRIVPFSAVSYLPLAHVIARVLDHYFGLLLGATLTCCADLNNLMDTRPTLFIGPRGCGKGSKRA